MGLPGFEPGSQAPEAYSLDQASRQPQIQSQDTIQHNLPLIIKIFHRNLVLVKVYSESN